MNTIQTIQPDKSANEADNEGKDSTPTTGAAHVLNRGVTTPAAYT